MSNMKRILEIIETDEELKEVYDSIIETPVSDEIYTIVMNWLYSEALAELKN